MTNPERGEVEIEVNGKPYTLRLGMNVAAAWQAKHKKKIGELVAESATLDFVQIRELAWLLLQKKHGEEFKTVELAGDFIDDAGGVSVFFKTLEDIMKANEAAGTGEAGGPANPSQSQAAATPGATSS